MTSLLGVLGFSSILALILFFIFFPVDSTACNPLHPEEHQKEQGGKGLALVEAYQHCPASYTGAADRGPNPRQRRKYNGCYTHLCQYIHCSFVEKMCLLILCMG